MNEELLSKIGKRIQSLREERGITQQELANALGVQRSVVGKWEAGLQDLKTENIIVIATYFDISCDYLLGMSDSRSSDISIAGCMKLTGLSEKSIEIIQHCDSNILKSILESQEFLKMVNLINRTINHKILYDSKKEKDSLILIDFLQNNKKLDEEVKSRAITAIQHIINPSIVYKERVSNLMAQMFDNITNNEKQECAAKDSESDEGDPDNG